MFWDETQHGLVDELSSRRSRPESRSQRCEDLVQVVLGLASAVTLGSKSRWAGDHIFLSNFRLSSLFVASYNSQVYGGSILAHLQTGLLNQASGNAIYMFLYDPRENPSGDFEFPVLHISEPRADIISQRSFMHETRDRGTLSAFKAAICRQLH
jgi:hypothetical protein